MAVEEQLKNVKEGVSVIVEVIKAAGDNPKVKEAGGELGKTALTLTKAINNILLPVAAVNFAFDKAKVYFANQFPIDIAQKATGIPQEKIVEPKASIAGPALQGLAFSHEEKDLKEMYLNLLVSAMDDRAGNLAHPAFVEIIKQLNAEEAKLLQTVLASDYSFPIAEIYFTRDTGKLHLTVNTLYRHLLDSRDEKLQPIEAPSLPAMVDNWIRLGLVDVNYQRTLVDEDYSWIERRPEFISECNKVTAKGTVAFRKGFMRRTAWGKQFSQAVGLADLKTVGPEK